MAIKYSTRVVLDGVVSDITNHHAKGDTEKFNAAVALIKKQVPLIYNEAKKTLKSKGIEI